MKWLAAFLLLALSADATTYYIDATNGLDANNGTSIATPWQHHPYMINWSGSYSHAAGSRYIFRGGTTWNSNCFPMIPLAGGTSSNVLDYYGVDQTWFVGGSFTRPVFDAGHWANPAGSINGGVVYVDYPHNAAHCLALDSIEIRAMMATTAFGPGLVEMYDTDNFYCSNLYLHDWKLTNSISTDDAHGGLFGLFDSSAPAGISNVYFVGGVIHNAENGPSGLWNGVCVREAGHIWNSTIESNSSAILFAQDVSNCTVAYVCYPYSGVDPTYHLNGFYMDGANGGGSFAVNCYCRNSTFHDISGGANTIYPNPQNYACYVLNNLLYGVQSAQQAIEIDPVRVPGSPGASSNVYVLNNTITNFNANAPGIHVVDRSSVTNPVGTLVIANNHVMGSGATLTDAIQGTTVNTLTTLSNLVQTPAQATAAGYSAAQANPFSPTSSSSPTVGVGTNLTSLGLFGIDILGVSRPTGNALWDIGAYEYLTTVSNTMVTH